MLILLLLEQNCYFEDYGCKQYFTLACNFADCKIVFALLKKIIIL